MPPCGFQFGFPKTITIDNKKKKQMKPNRYKGTIFQHFVIRLIITPFMFIGALFIWANSKDKRINFGDEWRGVNEWIRGV